MADKSALRILLCGFMGSGKTSVGEALAFHLKWNFSDTDSLIEKREGRSVPQIFKEDGEEYFRRAEEEEASLLGRKKKVVISTGGGFLTREETVKALRMADDSSTAVVYLAVDFETCYHRICGSTRPLVAVNTKEELKKIYDNRARLYTAASQYRVENTGEISETVAEIIRVLSL